MLCAMELNHVVVSAANRVERIILKLNFEWLNDTCSNVPAIKCVRTHTHHRIRYVLHDDICLPGMFICSEQNLLSFTLASRLGNTKKTCVCVWFGLNFLWPHFFRSHQPPPFLPCGIVSCAICRYTHTRTPGSDLRAKHCGSWFVACVGAFSHENKWINENQIFARIRCAHHVCYFIFITLCGAIIRASTCQNPYNCQLYIWVIGLGTASYIHLYRRLMLALA